MYQNQTTLHSEERTPALLIHLSPLANFILPSMGFLLGPLVAWLIYRDQSKLLDEQGKEALNYQITVLIANIAIGGIAFLLAMLGIFGSAITLGADGGLFAFLGMFGAFFAFYMPVMFIINIVPFIFMIIAALKVSNGEIYHYPMNIKFIK